MSLLIFLMEHTHSMVQGTKQYSIIFFSYLKVRLGLISKAQIHGVHLYGAVWTKNIFIYSVKGLKVTLWNTVLWPSPTSLTPTGSGFNVVADRCKCQLYLICCSNIIANMFTLQNTASRLSTQISVCVTVECN